MSNTADAGTDPSIESQVENPETEKAVSSEEGATQDEHDNADLDGRGSREAAKYRTRLRATEADLESTRATLAAVQRAAIENMVGTALSVPSDLFDIAGVNLSDLLDDNGVPDQSAVSKAVSEAIRVRPGLSRKATAADALVGVRTPPAQGNESASWSKVLRGD